MSLCSETYICEASHLFQWTAFISNNEGKANGSEAAEAKKEELLGYANGNKKEVDS